MTAKIAIVGGGPKAVAIAIKASVLKDAGLLECEIHVFEEREIGSSWSGRHGYTDGEQALCTPAEKDLGFPYSLFPGAPSVAQQTMERFSWSAFKASRNYADWVDRGRGPASHAEFADYLRWAFARSGAILHHGTVTKLEIVGLPGAPAKNGWGIFWRPSGGSDKKHDVIFDGVVVTGHGPPRELSTAEHARLLNGRDFWRDASRRQVAELIAAAAVTEDYPLVVIGSGGTAAAILAWFARQGFQDLPIVLLAEQATFYTRGDSVFENRLFSDQTHWKALTHRTRKLFFDRLTRGVVWQTVMEDLINLSALRFVEGRVSSICSILPGANLRVSWTRELNAMEIAANNMSAGEVEAGLVVNATGFDNWWFLDLLPPGIVPPDRDERSKWSARLAGGMDESLAFSMGWGQPRLHAPFHSMMIGPGFASLLALGDMADRVLRAYIPPSPMYPVPTHP